MDRVNPYLNNLAFFLVLFVALTLILSNALATTLAALIFAIWLMQTIAYKRQSFMEYPLFKLICALVGYKLIVLLISGYENGFGRALGQITFPLLYFAIPAVVVTAERRRHVLWLMISGAIIASGYGLIKYYLGLETRISSFVAGYYTLATYLSFATGILMVKFAFANAFKEKSFYLLVMIPLVAALIFTYVRACYLAVFLVILLIGLLKDRRLLVAVMAIVLITMIFFPKTASMIGKRFDLSSPNVMSERNILWSEGLAFAKGVPFFGYGINSFPALFDVESDERITDKTISTWHNLYLEALLDGGPLQLFFLGSLLLFQGRHSLAIYRRTRDSEKKVMHLIVIVMLIVIMVAGIFADVLRDPIISLGVWLLLGLSVI